MSEKQISKEIKRLEKLMVDHAKNLEFEKAARLRDQLRLLKGDSDAATSSGAEAAKAAKPAKAGARAGGKRGAARAGRYR